MREVFTLIDRYGDILWHDLSSDSPVALPDSRARWEYIWGLRDQIGVIAHSHPFGPMAFSSEDLSTMSALRLALGDRVFHFAVVAPEATIVRSEFDDLVLPRCVEPGWAKPMRLLSGMVIDSVLKRSDS